MHHAANHHAHQGAHTRQHEKLVPLKSTPLVKCLLCLITCGVLVKSFTLNVFLPNEGSFKDRLNL